MKKKTCLFILLNLILLLSACTGKAEPAAKTNSVTVSLKINELEEEPNDKFFEDLLITTDFIPMSETELLEYYGVTLPIEEALPFLKKQAHQRYELGIYKSDSRGIYYDTNSFTFKNEDGLQELAIMLAKRSIPYTGLTDLIEGFDPQSNQSVVNGVEMIIAHYMGRDAEKYYSEFVLNNNGYKIYAQDISLEEFVKALEAILG